MMNKILMDGEVLDLSDNSGEISIKVHGDGRINLISKNDLNITLELEDNAHLDFYSQDLNNHKLDLTINQKNASKVNLYHAFDNDCENNLNIWANVVGNDNAIDVHIKGVVRKKNMISVDGIVNPNSKNNFLKEDIKLLTLGGQAFVRPMLHIKALDVNALHNTTISNIRDDELFYLMAKGLSKETAISLIANSYTHYEEPNN